MRFQDFSILNGSAIVNYAAKLKELHGVGCKIFIRAIASEGLGPVHSSVLHSIICSFPGIKVVAPTSPNEYTEIWNDYLNSDCPYYISEHRDTYKNTKIQNYICDNYDIVIIGISACTNESVKAAYMLKEDGINSLVLPLTYLKPLFNKYKILFNSVTDFSNLALIVDPSYEYCSIGKEIAYRLMKNGCYAEVLSCTDNTKLLKVSFRNEYPKAESIYKKAKEMVRGKTIGIYGMTSP